MEFSNFRNRDSTRVDERIEDLAEQVIGAAIEVHRHLGPGFPESVYRLALSYELELRGIPHMCEAPVPVVYKGRIVGEGRMDLLAADVLIVELKVVESLNDTHRSQVIAYLKANNLQLGLLINFNVALLKDGLRRVIYTGDA